MALVVAVQPDRVGLPARVDFDDAVIASVAALPSVRVACFRGGFRGRGRWGVGALRALAARAIPAGAAEEVVAAREAVSEGAACGAERRVGQF